VTIGAHIDPALVDQPHRERELGVEAERAADLELLGDDQVLRQRHVAAEAELHDDAARAHRVEAGAQRPLVARAFEHHVERALVAA
jgi:hypothetical protein